MGLDIEKIKVKKDTKDAQAKAHQLFKKATNAINFANRANKKVNERIAAVGEEHMVEKKSAVSTIGDNKSSKSSKVPISTAPQSKGSSTNFKPGKA